ncbi:MAG: hypothetical protein ACTSQE_02905, partial [Candidatus Heimdallarchaeaceae archaeon]
GVIRVDSELRRVPIYQPEEMDNTDPTIFSLSDVLLEFNTTGNKLNWYANDPYPMNYPDNYTIYRNDTVVKKGTWKSDSYISVSIDNLERGIYSYKLLIQDEKGNLAEDNLYVEVVNETKPYIQEVADIQFFQGDDIKPISWMVTDTNLSIYWVEENGGRVDDGEWNTTSWNEEKPEIRYSISALDIGEHNITLIVEDIFGHRSVDTVIVTVKDPKDKINYEDYVIPPLEMGIIGLDTDDDQSMDTYYGFFGIIDYLSAEDYNEKILEPYLGATWRLRIPKDSPAHWEVLYYPDPLYPVVRPYLYWDAPVYFVNVTIAEGVNFEYEIDSGSNTTYGNITTYGQNNPLEPEYPEFPGFNVGLTLVTGTRENEVTATAGFFDSVESTISIISLSFITLYFFRKKKKTKINL